MKARNFGTSGFAVIALAFATMAGCGGNSSGAGAIPGPANPTRSGPSLPSVTSAPVPNSSGAGSPNVYVSVNGPFPGIEVFKANATGPTWPPLAEIDLESCAQLENVFGVAVDSTGKIYASFRTGEEFGGIVVSSPVVNGHSSPLYVLSGSNTGLDLVSGIAIGPGNVLYAVDEGNNSLTEYAPGESGDAAPIRTIKGTATGIDSPFSVAVDTTGKIYVSNTDVNTPFFSVTVYAANANANAAPVATITGSKTGLGGPGGLAVDGQGRIYVPILAVPGAKWMLFAAGANGNVAPISTTFGPDPIFGESPQNNSLAVDAAGRVYVSQNMLDFSTITTYAPNGAGPYKVLSSFTSLDTPASLFNIGEIAVH